MSKADLVRVHHMLDAATEAMSFVQNRSRADLGEDRMLSLALVKCVEIVGEAAAQVSTPFREKYPALPWSDIIAMRNRLIHAYFDVDLDRVWDTVTDDLPPLAGELGGILAAEGGGD